MNLLLSEEVIGTASTNSIQIQTEQASLTVKDLITLKVAETIAKEEKTRNEKSEVIDVEKHLYEVLDAFLTNQLFLIVNDRQVESFEENILIEEDIEIKFIRLTPLVGG